MILNSKAKNRPRNFDAAKVAGLCVFGFGFLVCCVATQLALQLHQERIHVVRSNEVVHIIPTEFKSERFGKCQFL